MKLVALTVKHFRSITQAHRLHLGHSTILIGPNNEGKSNILRALVVGLSALTRPKIGQSYFQQNPYERHLLRNRLSSYDWEVDYPIGQQQAKPGGRSEILLEFELTPLELDEFRERIGSNLNGSLPIRITLGREKAVITVSKQGRGAKALSAKAASIADFVRERIDFQYIPAVRTEEAAQVVVDRLLAVELASVESDPAYKDALAQIAAVQKPVLDRVSQSIKSTLVQFLPAIRKVEVQIATEARLNALRTSSRVIIDDGSPTELKYKGDGVQSLAALALMRQAPMSTTKNKHMIVAVEEPESHLHPSAIHELRQVFQELARNQQVVLTTHCPLFVDRARVSSNILVRDSKARSAKSVSEIREVLGVRASDNLRHAELVLLVEGEDDKIALSALLNSYSTKLANALNNGALAIDALGGGTNLAYKVGLVKEALCDCHCYLDNDKAGKDSFEKARHSGLLIEADVNFSIVEGRLESEIEDTYDEGIYATFLSNKYRVSMQSPKWRSRKKWSDRMFDIFKHQGKQWDERTKAALKASIAELVASGAAKALHPSRRSSFDSLAKSLEDRLTARST